MSDSDSVDMLNPVPQFTFVGNSSCKKMQAHANKKRKAAAAVSSAANSDNEAAVVNSSQNSQNAAYYLQLAIDNLKLAAKKEVEQSIQAKIQALTAKVESILLKNDSESESESESVQNQLQIIRTEFADKFNQIQTWISGMKSTTSADASTDIAVNAANAVDLTENSSFNSIQNFEKKTYTQALQTEVLQSSNENQTDSSTL